MALFLTNGTGGNPQPFPLNGFRPSCTSEAKTWRFSSPHLAAQAGSICDEVTLPESLLSLPRYYGYMFYIYIWLYIKDAEVKTELISHCRGHRAGGEVALPPGAGWALPTSWLGAKDFTACPDQGTEGIVSQACSSQHGQQTPIHQQQLRKKAQSQTSICPVPVSSSLFRAGHRVLAPSTPVQE